MYKARNYNHPKKVDRKDLEIQENSFHEYQSPKLKKFSKYIKDFSDEIVLKPFNLSKKKTAQIGLKRQLSQYINT